MTKKGRALATASLLLGLLLGLTGAFLLSGVSVALADIAISDEIGSQVTINPNPDLAISDEVSSDTGTDGEGTFTTLPDDDDDDDGGGGGGGGGGSSGGRRSPRPAPPEVLGERTCVFPYLTKYIKFGAPNDPVEVVKLQRLLREFEGFELAITGIYDEPTLTAVMIFQRRYAGPVLEPWGLSVNQPTGFVFITTTLTINNLYCERSLAHNLDLRNAYDGEPGFAPALKSKEGGASGETWTDLGPLGLWSATGTATTSGTTTLLNLGAGGLVGFLKDSPWIWLWPLLILILVLLIYLVWRERRDRQEFLAYDDESYQAPDSEELRVSEDDEVEKE
jgi:hypothetical protein